MSDDPTMRWLLGGFVLAFLLLALSASKAALSGFEGASWLLVPGNWVAWVVLAAAVTLLGGALVVLGVRYLLTLIGLGRFSTKRVLCAP
jgi:hypothetical protein